MHVGGGFNIGDTIYSLVEFSDRDRMIPVGCKGKVVGALYTEDDADYGSPGDDEPPVSRNFDDRLLAEFDGYAKIGVPHSAISREKSSNRCIQGDSTTKLSKTWYKGTDLPRWFCGVLHFEVKVENSGPASEFYVGFGKSNSSVFGLDRAPSDLASHMLCYWKSNSMQGSTIHSNQENVQSTKAISPAEVWEIAKGDILRVELDTSERTDRACVRFFKNGSLVSAVMLNVNGSVEGISPYFCVYESVLSTTTENNSSDIVYGDDGNDEMTEIMLSLTNSSGIASSLETIEVLRVHDYESSKPTSYSFDDFITTDDTKLKCLLTDPIEFATPWFHRRLHGSPNLADKGAKAQHNAMLATFKRQTQLSSDSEKMKPKYQQGAYLVRPSVERPHEDAGQVSWFYLCSKDKMIVVRGGGKVEKRINGSYQMTRDSAVPDAIRAAMNRGELESNDACKQIYMVRPFAHLLPSFRSLPPSCSTSSTCTSASAIISLEPHFTLCHVVVRHVHRHCAIDLKTKTRA